MTDGSSWSRHRIIHLNTSADAATSGRCLVQGPFRFRSFVVGLGGGLRARGLGPELVVGPVVMGRNHRHVQCPALSEPEPLLPSKSF